MPAESKAESKFLNWKFGHGWVKEHHFDNSTAGLPEHVKKKAKEFSERKLASPRV
jgi:hypothetical protein